VDSIFEIMRPLLDIKNLSKEYFGVPALKGVSCNLQQGEIKGILGENGAGKSTFMKCLSGIEEITSGELFLEGKRFVPTSAFEAMNSGVVLVHQELNLCEELTVHENVWLGTNDRLLAAFDHEEEKRVRSVAALKSLGFTSSIDCAVWALTIGDKQLIEIAKALVRRPKVLILDEPTSSLGDKEAQLVIDVVKKVAAGGVGVFYISHKMDEIEKLCDTVLVLRDGEKVFEGSAKTSHEMLYEQIAKRKKSVSIGVSSVSLRSQDSVLLTMNGDSGTTVTLPRGALIGILGLSGAGKTSLLEELSGFWPTATTFNPDVAAVPTEKRALVPDDRKKKGLLLSWSIKDNVALSADNPWYAKIDGQRESCAAEELIVRNNVKARGPDSIMQYLSGGNQQKVLLGNYSVKILNFCSLMNRQEGLMSEQRNISIK
jgi:ribose transport system ATP-binding protein